MFSPALVDIYRYVCEQLPGANSSLDRHQTSSVIPLATGDEVVNFERSVGGICALLTALLVVTCFWSMAMIN